MRQESNKPHLIDGIGRSDLHSKQGASDNI